MRIVEWCRIPLHAATTKQPWHPLQPRQPYYNATICLELGRYILAAFTQAKPPSIIMFEEIIKRDNKPGKSYNSGFEYFIKLVVAIVVYFKHLRITLLVDRHDKPWKFHLSWGQSVD